MQNTETTDKGYTHVPKPVYKREMSQCCGIKKGENMRTDRCRNIRGQKCFAKGNGKEAKI